MSKEKEDKYKKEKLVPRVYHLTADHIAFLDEESAKNGIKKPEYFRTYVLDPFINRYKKKIKD